jgi:hypothetical protein
LNIDSNTSVRDNNNRDEEMRQIRLRQQEISNERAIAAAKDMKYKQDEEKERKNMVAKVKPTTKGNKLGKATTTGYNSKQPWNK